MHAAIAAAATLDLQFFVEPLSEIAKGLGRLPQLCVLLLELSHPFVTLTQFVLHDRCRARTFDACIRSSWASFCGVATFQP